MGELICLASRGMSIDRIKAHMACGFRKGEDGLRNISVENFLSEVLREEKLPIFFVLKHFILC